MAVGHAMGWMVQLWTQLVRVSVGRRLCDRLPFHFLSACHFRQSCTYAANSNTATARLRPVQRSKRKHAVSF